MQAVASLEPAHFYHIYNRGNNREDLFYSERDYRHFIELYAHLIHPRRSRIASMPTPSGSMLFTDAQAACLRSGSNASR